MEKDQVFQIIKKNIIEVVPELADREITLDDSLKLLGANSVDRAEILIQSMAALKIKAPLAEFAQAKNLSELSDIFCQHLNQSI
jgi:polyketide biosynthesis acyl carrier protein